VILRYAGTQKKILGSKFRVNILSGKIITNNNQYSPKNILRCRRMIVAVKNDVPPHPYRGSVGKAKIGGDYQWHTSKVCGQQKGRRLTGGGGHLKAHLKSMVDGVDGTATRPCRRRPWAHWTIRSAVNYIIELRSQKRR
jgi:hypothetical protein